MAPPSTQLLITAFCEFIIPSSHSYTPSSLTKPHLGIHHVISESYCMSFRSQFKCRFHRKKLAQPSRIHRLHTPMHPACSLTVTFPYHNCVKYLLWLPIECLYPLLLIYYLLRARGVCLAFI